MAIRAYLPRRLEISQRIYTVFELLLSTFDPEVYRGA